MKKINKKNLAVRVTHTAVSVVKLTFLCLLMLCLYTAAYTQPGTLDNRFGDKGRMLDSNFRGAAEAIAIQKNGKIVVAGNYVNGGGIHFSRYNSDGSLDINFGKQGRQIISVEEYYRFGGVVNMILQEDGKILAGAWTVPVNSSYLDMAIVRLNTDGSLDNSFGGNGIASIVLSPWRDIIGEIALQQDGKLVVAGLRGVQNTNIDSQIPFVLRLNTDGSFDESFGSNHTGIVVQDFRDIYVQIRSLCILPDGKIIMGGEDDGYKDMQVALFKYNTDGSLDQGFGNNGIMESSFPKDEYGHNIVGSIYDILVLPNGRLFCSGETSYSRFLLCQFNVDGSTDNSFGDGKGYAVFPSFPGYCYGRQAHLAKGGKILVYGSYTLPGGIDDGTGLYRFNSDGSLDSSFGTNGIAVNGFGHYNGLLSLRASTVQPDGKIVTGVSIYPPYDDEYAHIGLMRFNGDGGISPAGYVRIKKWMNANGITWPGAFFGKGNSYQVEHSSNGVSFTPVATVSKPDGNGNYVYQDPSPVKGNNYYRIAYHDEKGNKTYSNIIAIENIDVQVWPNPVTQTLQVSGLAGKGVTQLRIADLAGNIKMAVNTQAKNFNWNVGRLPKGHYILQINNANSNIAYRKFLKQ